MENRELLTCSCCEEQFEELDSNDMCDGCADDHVRCDHCGALTHNDDTNVVYESDGVNSKMVICQECFNEHTFRCVYCHETIIGNSDTVDGDDWCETCAVNHAVRCEHCDCLTRHTMGVECSRGTEEWCEDCRCDYAIECDNCGTMHYSGICCPDCGGEDDSESRDGIRSYDYKPRPTFVGTGDRFFGVELEVEAISGQGAFDIPNDDNYSNIYYKHDGSLDNGFEIVTEPHSLEAFYESFAVKSGLFGAIDALQEKAKSHNTTTCGLHVHVSRPSILTTAKMMSFVYRNIKMFEVLCRRKCGRYCDVYNIPVVNKNYDDLLTDGSRYAAIADRGKTLEFRLPKGTLKAATVMATIEMVHALVAYCEQTPVIQLTAEGFLKLCGTYKYLSKYDRYIKLMTDGAPAVSVPRRKVPKNERTSRMLCGIREAYENLFDTNADATVADATIGDRITVVEPILNPAYIAERSMPNYQETDRMYDHRTIAETFYGILTDVMNTHSSDIISLAEHIATSEAFMRYHSKIDAVLVATVDVFTREHGFTVEDVAMRVVRAGYADRVRTMFYGVA